MASLTTLIAVIGDTGARATRAVAERAPNVSFEEVGEVPDDLLEAFTAIRTAWRKAVTHGSVYTLVDADPLAPVVAEWGARLVGKDHQLELAIGLTGADASPDYYLVSPGLRAPAVDWYHGLLHQLCPQRVVATEMKPAALLATLANLKAGPSPPGPSALAARARDYVPLPKLI